MVMDVPGSTCEAKVTQGVWGCGGVGLWGCGGGGVGVWVCGCVDVWMCG